MNVRQLQMNANVVRRRNTLEIYIKLTLYLYLTVNPLNKLEITIPHKTTLTVSTAIFSFLVGIFLIRCNTYAYQKLHSSVYILLYTNAGLQLTD